MMQIYKPKQGKYTRTITFAAIMLIGIVGAVQLSDKIAGYTTNAFIVYGVPTLLIAALAAGLFWVVNRAKSADFLIATESEMKKVSWSSRKEIVGSTKVVIVTTFILAALLFLVDVVFRNLFRFIDVLKV